MSALPSYGKLVANFGWSLAECGLGYTPKNTLNIGWMCSDRLCQIGLGSKVRNSTMPTPCDTRTSFTVLITVLELL